LRILRAKMRRGRGDVKVSRPLAWLSILCSQQATSQDLEWEGGRNEEKRVVVREEMKR
jgi:hypothetical protein